MNSSAKGGARYGAGRKPKKASPARNSPGRIQNTPVLRFSGETLLTPTAGVSTVP